MHDVGEGEGINAHRQHCGGQQSKNQELARADVLQRCDMVVGDCAEHDALVHPERIGRTKDQRAGGRETDPEIEFDGAKDDHLKMKKPRVTKPMCEIDE